MRILPDDLKHPSGGERLQGAASDAVRLAHRGLERFPDLVKRHKFIAGGAAVSSSLLVLAGVAIARRLRSGQSEEEALASLTEEELTGHRDERTPWSQDAATTNLRAKMTRPPRPKPSPKAMSSRSRRRPKSPRRATATPPTMSS